MDELELHHLQQPFPEATSGKQAYGAGPGIAPSEEGQLHVDFNLAYNPYRAYNDAFARPT